MSNTSRCCAIIELISRLHCVDQLDLLRNQLCITQFESKGAKLYLKWASDLTHWNVKFALFEYFNNIPVFLVVLY